MTREAILFSYDTRREKFDSLYDRNKFYRGLFGYRQTVRENGKVYRYEKKGLINKMPHIKVEDSVIILLEEDSPCLKEYLERWSKKVDYRTFRVILEKDQLEELKSSVEKV